jgi:hypothetical protein
MDEVAAMARGLVDENEVVRLRAIAGLARFPNNRTAIAELMESVKNDLLGELSIVAALALATMTRDNPAIHDLVDRKYRETVGSIALYGGYDPTLRLSYYFAAAGRRDWFETMRVEDVIARTAEYRQRVGSYRAAGRTGDVRAAARLMVWFEALDDAGQPLVFKAARKLMPGWDEWLVPLVRATHRRWFT